MPTDGLTRYDKLSGADLVVELQGIDQSRFPRNYQTLLREIASRGPVATPQLLEHDVERYDALSHSERRQFLGACVRRIGILLLQYQVLGGFAASVLGHIAEALVEKVSGSLHPKVHTNVTLIILLFLSIASYWAFLRWMLQERVADMEVAIIRRKQSTPISNTSGALPESPNNPLQLPE
jgi:hypothetical protein